MQEKGEKKVKEAEKIANRIDDMPTSPQDLFNLLKDNAISYDLYHHAAVFTVAESENLDRDIPGTHCRNLFLRDKKKRNFLLVLQNSTQVDIKKLQELLGCDRLSFGSPERLWQYLGVYPGSVCPFSIINDTDKQVEIYLDQSMMETEIVNYHPLLNTMTVSLRPADLIKFIEMTGHKAHSIDLSLAKPDI